MRKAGLSLTTGLLVVATAGAISILDLRYDAGGSPDLVAEWRLRR